MMLDYKWLLEDEVLDKRLLGILQVIRKDAPTEYISTLLYRYGIMTAKQLVNYINRKGYSSVPFIIPEKKEVGDFIKLEEYVDLEEDRRKFAIVCDKYRLFPHHIDNNIMVWLAQEMDEEKLEGDSLIEIYQTYAETLSEKFKDRFKLSYVHKIEFTIKPLFEEELRKFCVQNSLPYNSGDVYIAKPEYQAEYYIIKGVINHASDIYFDPKSSGIRVAYSILNDYILDDLINLDDVKKKNFLDKVLILTGIQPKDRPKEVVVDRSIKDLAKFDNKYNGRTNFFRNQSFDAVCIRVVDKSKKAIPFEILNIRESRKKAIIKLMHNYSGIILEAGSTGSGKSTTMGSILSLLAKMYKFRRIETVEDPIEQVLEEISQLTLEGSGATYDDVAKSLTRRNASILYIGELNTPITVNFGVSSALMNLLILSTIHSMDGKSVPDRVRSMTISDPSIYEQFLQVIRGIIHQTMLKEACPKCLTMVDRDESPIITNDMNTVLDYYGYTEKKIPIAQPQCDCPICEGRGFIITKPVIAVEVAIIDESLTEDILEAPRHKIATILHEKMRNDNLTGVQDALDYIREQKLDWLQVWDKFSLFNKVSKCVQDGDKKYANTSFNTIDKRED